jgi:hypothetical protein
MPLFVVKEVCYLEIDWVCCLGGIGVSLHSGKSTGDGRVKRRYLPVVTESLLRPPLLNRSENRAISLAPL